MSNDVREDGCLKGDQAGGIIGFLITAPLPPPRSPRSMKALHILLEFWKRRGKREEERKGSLKREVGRLAQMRDVNTFTGINLICRLLMQNATTHFKDTPTQYFSLSLQTNYTGANSWLRCEAVELFCVAELLPEAVL